MSYGSVNYSHHEEHILNWETLVWDLMSLGWLINQVTYKGKFEILYFYKIKGVNIKISIA